jgi:hypothetical protein
MATCNGCDLRVLKTRHGDKLVKFGENWYIKDNPPCRGQSPPLSLNDGTPIRFVAWFMSEEHSEDCGIASR